LSKESKIKSVEKTEEGFNESNNNDIAEAADTSACLLGDKSLLILTMSRLNKITVYSSRQEPVKFEISKIKLLSDSGIGGCYNNNSPPQTGSIHNLFIMKDFINLKDAEKIVHFLAFSHGGYLYWMNSLLIAF
jgi:hypothetical protein